VHCEDLLVNDCCDGQTVEAICKCLPELDIVPSLALVVEAVDTIDGGAFVVAAQDEEIFGVFDLVCEEQADGLKGLLASVDIVSQEQVVGLGREAAIFKQTEEVIILAVNITTYLRAHDSSQHVSPQQDYRIIEGGKCIP